MIMDKDEIYSGSNHDFAVEVSGGRIGRVKRRTIPQKEGTLAEEGAMRISHQAVFARVLDLESLSCQ